MSKNRKIDIIYNITKICPWDCDICCVDAVQVTKKNNQIVIKQNSLKETEIIDIKNNDLNIYETVSLHKQLKGSELNFKQKIDILKNLKDYDVKIDISGGDALKIRENYEFLKIASQTLGKHNVTLTATGIGLDGYDIEELTQYIDEYNFTFDAVSLKDVSKLRPNGYAISNLNRAKEFVKYNCKTRAEMPLTNDIIDKDHIYRIYKTLHEANIGKLLLMRLFPVGRGMDNMANIPTAQEYKKVINYFKELEQEFKTPKLKLQCALKYLYKENFEINPCDMVTNSFGLMPDGTLLASPWAMNSCGKPMSDAWVMGNLSKSTLAEILDKKQDEFCIRCNENFGQCKMQAYLNSKKENEMDRMFDHTDPLYQKNI